MAGSVGNITTDIIKNGLVFNMDAANRASTIPSISTTKAFNTVDTAISGAFTTDGIYDSSTISPSFNFDDIDERISIPEFTFSGEFTLSMWINPEAITGNNTFILGRWNNNFDNDIRISLSNNTPIVTFRIGGGSVVFYGYTTSSTIPLNEWSHLSIIRNSSNDINCYLNGVQFSTTTGSSTNTLTLDSIGRVINTSYGWNGNIGPIHMYNRALSASEVLHNYNALKGRFE